MTDPKLPDETGESNADRPAWLLGSINEDQPQQPDLIDPVEDAPAPAPDSAGAVPETALSPDPDLELSGETSAGFTDDTTGIIGHRQEPEDVEPVTANATTSDFDSPHRDDLAAASDPEYVGDDDPQPSGFTTAAPPPASAPEPPPFTPPTEDEAAPVDVLANRPMPDAGPSSRRDYDLSKTDPEAWKDDAVDPQVTATASAFAGASPTGDSDDLTSTKVRRQSLLQSEDVKQVSEPAETAWYPRAEDAAFSPAEASLLEEATVIPDIPSRAAARLWSFLITLILAPFAWYLIADAAARLTLATGNPWQSGQINPAALIELAGGIVLALVILGYLVRSSLGAIIWGVVIAAGGALFLAVPTLTQRYLEPAQQWLRGWNDFGANVAHHLEWTGSTGAIFTGGLLLFALGIIAVMARRDGKREAEIRAQIERIAPGTLTKKH